MFNDEILIILNPIINVLEEKIKKNYKTKTDSLDLKKQTQKKKNSNNKTSVLRGYLEQFGCKNARKISGRLSLNFIVIWVYLRFIFKGYFFIGKL